MASTSLIWPVIFFLLLIGVIIYRKHASKADKAFTQQLKDYIFSIIENALGKSEIKDTSFTMFFLRFKSEYIVQITLNPTSIAYNVRINQITKKLKRLSRKSLVFKRPLTIDIETKDRSQRESFRLT